MQALIRRPLEAIGQGIINAIEAFGLYVSLCFQALFWAFKPPYRIRLLMLSMESVGFGSLFIVLLTGLFTGMVFALQGAYAFGLFGAEALVGSTVALSITRELGPVLTALMVTGRAGSGMATELGTMRVTEQIDALETMAVNPIQYLLVPRIIAGIAMVPLLTMLFNIVGIVGAYAVGVGLLEIDAGAFIHYTKEYLAPKDIWSGLVKGAVFGFMIASIGCYKGFSAKGGAKGVGEATTEAVVLCSVSILVVDYFLTALIW